MKDVNFFAPYLDRKKMKFNNKTVLMIIVAILLISITAYGVVNNFKIMKLTESRDEYQALAENPKTVKKVRIIRNEEDELKQFEEEIESIRSLNESVERRDRLSSDYIADITGKKPDELFLESLNIGLEGISMTGVSKDRLSIAELGKGLDLVDGLEDVFISSINKNELNYEFSLTASDILSEDNIELEDEDLEVEDGSNDEEFEEEEDD